ncbi:hypothetical protein RCG47_05390 [Staphylococcus simulans]|uniref:Uncharacterized protein n=1 Tax=Staphylococcus simulans UMC-CNS-990 TaxID=1405498 RepID=A0ABP2YUW8_STASI|nr:hypothetical protein [Staphylococcus simulans]ERS93572.1 hypothetical protein SSIM_05075 [Staphylococcus simulans UMC-CNS-990]MCE5148619.1 hypothetical protein [Staphylococcus simulans]MDQ7113571.1 hypothetical protein [Staphylococcus simulans]MDQ7114543.1 hypothetical protein [Staphylococcus simulans]MDQ7117148.1 hypothetical protein [Staphylococcus simulans]
MKHYLYTDKEFIYSYLSQHGKGLNLSYSQMNKNTSAESETRNTQNSEETQNINGKEDGNLTIGASVKVMTGEYSTPSQYKFKINKNELQESLKFMESKSEAQSELYNIELHDYLYEIFENTAMGKDDKISLYPDKKLTIAELDGNHFKFLEQLMDIYIKSETSSFIGIDKNTREEFTGMKKDLKPLEKMSAIIDKLVPGDYKIILDHDKQSLIGSLYIENLNVPFKELKYFYAQSKLNVVGIKASKIEFNKFEYENVFEVIQLDASLQGPLLNELLPNESIYYFKPILIYSNI